MGRGNLHSTSVIIGPAACVGVLAIVAALALHLSPEDIAVNHDVIRDLISARDFLQSNGSTIGHQSQLVFHHGVAWYRFLALWLWMAAPLELVPAILGILAAWPLYLVLRRATDRSTAAAFTMTSWWFIFSSARWNLWSPNALPLVVFLFLWLAQLGIQSSGQRRLAFSLGAAFTLGVGTQIHLQVGYLLPGAAYFALRRSRSEGGSMRPAAFAAAGNILAFVLSWALISPGSLAQNLRLLPSAFGQAGALVQGFGAEADFAWRGLWRLGLAATAFAGVSRLLGRGASRDPFDGLLLSLTASYLLFLTALLLAHPLLVDVEAIYGPLAGFLWILGARAVHRWVENPGRKTVLLLAALAATAGRFVHQPPSGEQASPGSILQLGELRSICSTLQGWGYDDLGMFRSVSGGQTSYLQFLAGLWFYATPRTGGRTSPEDRVALLSVPRDRPTPSGIATFPHARLRGEGRDFILMRFSPFVRLDRISLHGEGASGAFHRLGEGGLAVDRRFNLTFNARMMIPLKASPLRFYMRVPRGAPARTLYLPALDAVGRSQERCAGRIVAVSGAKAVLRSDGRSMRVAGSGKDQEGSVTIAWPTGDKECFPAQNLFYPMPVLELPADSFAELEETFS